MNWATTRFLASLRRPLWTAPIAELPSLKDGATAWFSVSQVWDSYCYLLGHSLLYTQRQCHWLCPRMTVWAQLRLNSDKMNRSIADGEIKAYAGHSSLSVWASCLPLHQTNGESGSLLTFISNAYQSHLAFPDDPATSSTLLQLLHFATSTPFPLGFFLLPGDRKVSHQFAVLSAS